VAWEAVAHFKRELDRRKSGEIDVRAPHTANGNGVRAKPGGWTLIDGRGKSCAGVIAAISKQVEQEPGTFVEAILADALNIYDVIAWTEQAGHRLLTQRREADGTTRVFIQPKSAVPAR
jgi:TusA-related sulfurtransferase